VGSRVDIKRGARIGGMPKCGVVDLLRRLVQVCANLCDHVVMEERSYSSRIVISDCDLSKRYYFP